MTRERPILPYSVSHTAYVEYDAAVIDVARRAIDLIERTAPWLAVEHIGSTAIPGCAGKGIVDLMALYPQGKLGTTRAAIDGLGFQRQTAGHVFPEDRPMRIGRIEYDGTAYDLHVHVVAADSAESASLRRFRDVLRADPVLRDAYQAKKRAILESGVSKPSDYTYAKGEFINAVLGRD
jgi:GrpB-like predicted nucleotidyltransferase (UPF0157 family)